MERRLKESAYGYMEWLLNQYIHHTRRKVWEPLSEMFPLRQEGYLMLIRINKQHLILNEEMKREIGYFIKKHLIGYIVNYISGQRNRKSAGCVGLVRIKN